MLTIRVLLVQPVFDLQAKHHSALVASFPGTAKCDMSLASESFYGTLGYLHNIDDASLNVSKYYLHAIPEAKNRHSATVSNTHADSCSSNVQASS